MTARRTWRFFETFVTPADNMLPPDNFQEDPASVLARRTSPTNIGLYLLSVTAAHDFGWTGLLDTVERLEATLATMARLQRFRGHFYNWYGTEDLRALEPAYVSTVDSGNLAGHLIALANACRTWREGEAPYRAGLADTAGIAAEEMTRLSEADALPPGLQDASAALAVITAKLAQAPQVDRSADLAGLAVDTSAAALTTCPLKAGSLAFWITALHRLVESHRRDQFEPTDLALRLLAIEQAARGMALDMEFGFLRNAERKLLSIGFLADEGALDTNCYDLLASEARLACFVAIAKGDIPASRMVQARSRRNTHGGRCRAGVLVGIDVRISDAVPGHARAGRQPAGGHQPIGRASPDRVW